MEVTDLRYYTGVIFDSMDEDAVQDARLHLAMTLEFEICHREHDTPRFMAIKEGKVSLELVEKTMHEFCEKKGLKFPNIFIFHSNRIRHVTEERCGELYRVANRNADDRSMSKINPGTNEPNRYMQ